MKDGRRATPADLSLIAASCWLALFLVVAKAFSWRDSWVQEFGQGAATLLASSWTDVLFALGCGVAGQLVTLVAGLSSKRAAALVRRSFLALFVVFAIYGFVSIGLFRYFTRPLTFQLLTLVANAAAIRSSVAERITWALAIAFVAVPAIYLWLATRGISRRAAVIGVCISGVWAVAGAAYSQRHQREPHELHLGVNPHVELVRTALERMRSGPAIALPTDAPAEYVNEFRTFGARGVTELSHFQLPAGVPPPRNTVVIVLESVGTKYLHLYGYPEEITPNISAASRQALVFDNIYAHASFTYASFRPINFSVYPGVPWHYALLNDARPIPGTLAAQLKQRGARTAYITSGDLDWGAQRWLLQHGGGFDVVEGYANLPCSKLSSWGAEDRCAFDRLIGWIDEEPTRPFFAILWTDQTHDPYRLSATADAPAVIQPKPNVPFAEDLSRYLTVLGEVDAQIGRLLTALRERGVADDTLVVITGDHGEAFADPHTQRGHAWTVFDEEARVPLILSNARLFPTADRVPTIGGHVDLNPTLADMLGLPPDREWQGHSLFDHARPQRAFLLAIAGGDVFGLRDGKWKYVYDVTSGRESLFDLSTDPSEQIDVVEREPAIALELRRRVGAWVSFEDSFLWAREN